MIFCRFDHHCIWSPALPLVMLLKNQFKKSSNTCVPLVQYWFTTSNELTNFRRGTDVGAEDDSNTAYGTAARVGTFSLAFATSDWRASRHRDQYRGERCEEEASRHWAACAKRRWPHWTSAKGHGVLQRWHRCPVLRWSKFPVSQCANSDSECPSNVNPMPCHEKISWSSYKKNEDSLSFECISRFMHLLGIVAPSFERWCAHVGTCFCIAVLLFSK